MSDLVDILDVRQERTTPRAILFFIDGQRRWISRDLIHQQRHAEEPSGPNLFDIAVPRWFAERFNLNYAERD